MSRFDEASKAGFTQDRNINFIRGKNKKQNEEDMYPVSTTVGTRNKNKDGVEKILSSANFDTESLEDNIEKNMHNLASVKIKTEDHEDIKVDDEIPIADDKLGNLAEIPEHFERPAFKSAKEQIGPFQLDQIELMQRFNANKANNSFKKYLKKHTNVESTILKVLTNTKPNYKLQNTINLDKNAHSKFITSNFTTTNNPRVDNFFKTMFSTLSDNQNIDNFELEGYSEQIYKFKNTLNDNEIQNVNLEDTFKKMLQAKGISRNPLNNLNLPSNNNMNINNQFAKPNTQYKSNEKYNSSGDEFNQNVTNMPYYRIFILIKTICQIELES